MLYWKFIWKIIISLNSKKVSKTFGRTSKTGIRWYYCCIVTLPSNVQTPVKGERDLGREMFPGGMQCPWREACPSLSSLLFSKGGQPSRITWKILGLYKQRRLTPQLDASPVLNLLICPGRCSQSILSVWERLTSISWWYSRHRRARTVLSSCWLWILKEGQKSQFWEQHCQGRQITYSQRSKRTRWSKKYSKTVKDEPGKVGWSQIM